MPVVQVQHDVGAAAVAPTPAAPATLPYRRWAALLALLVGELLLLSVSFDFGVLTRDPRWWAGWLLRASFLPQLAVVAGTMILVFGGAQLRAELERLAQRGVRSAGRRSALRAPRWALAGHLAAFAGFAVATDRVLEPGGADAGWVGAWLALAAATAGLWAAAALSPRLWPALLRRGRGVVLFGLAAGAAAWAAGRLAQELWRPLGRATLEVVHRLLQAGYAQTWCDPDEFVVGARGDRDFGVTIAPDCSGYEGVGLVWAFLAFYLWFCRGRLRFPHALLLLPLGTAIVWLGNALRIAGLVALGASWSPAVAVGGFHSQAGWLAFNAAALGLVAVAQHGRFFRRPSLDVAPAGRNAAAPYLVPFLAAVATGLATAAFADGFDWLYPLRVAAAAGALWYYRRAYAPLRRPWSWSAVGVGAAAFAVWMLLGPLLSGTPAAGTAGEALAGAAPGWAAAWLACRVLGSVVTAPVIEELAFRGYLTRRLLAADFESVPLGHFSWFAFLASSLLFGLVHGHWLAGTAVGLLYALALARRGSLGDAIAAHATTNALITAYVLATGSWGWWA